MKMLHTKYRRVSTGTEQLHSDLSLPSTQCFPISGHLAPLSLLHWFMNVHYILREVGYLKYCCMHLPSSSDHIIFEGSATVLRISEARAMHNTVLNPKLY